MAILPGKRIRDNSIFGTLTSAISAVAGSINSAELADLSAITGDHAIVTLDPFRQSGDPEIVMINAHTASSTSASVQRGMYGTTARAHAAGTQWAHAATVEDFADVVTSVTLPSDQYEGQLVYQTDTDSYRYFDGVTWRALGAGSPSTLAFTQSSTNQVVDTAQIITDLSMTVTVPAGRLLRISASSQTQSAAASNWFVEVLEDGTAIGRLWIDDFVGAASRTIMDGFILRSPTAGTHTYTFRAVRFGGSGTINIEGTGTDNQKRSLIEDITGTETPFAGNSVPVGQLGYTTSETTATTSGTTELDLGLSVNVVVPAGRVLRVTHHDRDVTHTVAGDLFQWRIKDNGTEVGHRIDRSAAAAGDAIGGHTWSVIVSPSSGAHVYTVTSQRIGGTGVQAFNRFASGINRSAYLLVEDITPTPSSSSGAPSSTLAYSENIALSQAVVATTADLSGLSVNVTVPAGRRLKITGHVYVETGAGAPSGPFMQIMEGATRFQFAQHYGGASPDISNTLECAAIISPSAGTHTYKLQGGVGAGDTVTFLSGSNFPAFILVEDITGSIWPQGSQVTSGIIASEAWTTYTPVLTADGGNPTMGTGAVLEGRFIKNGRTVTGSVRITFGTAGAAPGTGFYRVSAPFPTIAQIGGHTTVVGSGYVFDASVGVGSLVSLTTFMDSGSSVFSMIIPGNLVGATTPFTWANNDQLRIDFTYETVS